MCIIFFTRSILKINFILCKFLTECFGFIPQLIHDFNFANDACSNTQYIFCYAFAIINQAKNEYYIS